MATRFGAHSPMQAYAAKVRWLVAGLSSCIVLLGASLLYVAMSVDGFEPTMLPASVANAEIPPQVDILVAGQRIESGFSLSSVSLSTKAINPDRVPLGAVLASERSEFSRHYATREIFPGAPIIRDDLSRQTPLKELNIPPGFRALTLRLDKREAGNGFVTPSSRVDLLWHYLDRGTTRVGTIANFVKVLAVQGRTDRVDRTQIPERDVHVTVLLTAGDARDVELARTLGSISLALVSAREAGIVKPRAGSADKAVLIKKVFDIGEEEQIEPSDGTMVEIDPETGERQFWELRAGRWQRKLS